MIKIKSISILFFISILSINVFAQSSLLWKIEGNNITKPIYLFGTIHLIPGDKFSVSKKLDSIALNSDNVVFEMKLDDPELAQISLKKLALDSVPKLEMLYTKKEYKKLTKKLKDMGIPYVLFEQFKPFVLQQQVLSTLVSNPKGYETYFLGLVKSKKVQIGGLDSPEVQLSSIDSIPLKIQAKSLYDLVMKPEKSQEELRKLFEVYQSNDVDKIFDYINKEKDFSSLSNSLLDIRNLRWIDTMVSMFDNNQSYFIAVGAAHLGGPQGLIKLLRDKGYSVTAISKE